MKEKVVSMKNVEDDPPSSVLLPEEIDYTSNKFFEKIPNKICI